MPSPASTLPDWAGVFQTRSPRSAHELELSITPRLCSGALIQQPVTASNFTVLKQAVQATMSSLLDEVLRSDNAAQQDLRSDAPSSSGARRRQVRSSSRPRGPPSVSTPGMQSDMGGFPDDEIVGRRGTRRQIPPGSDIPRVVDTTGETLSVRFQEFLEE